MKHANRKVTRNEQVNLVDLFYYLLGNWYWFVITIGICLAVAYYRYARTTFSYASPITTILKNPSTSTRSARLDQYNNMINTVSISTEELQLRSTTLMAEVVKALDADVLYWDRIKVRNVELYTSLSPVRMYFSRTDNDPGTFAATISICAWMITPGWSSYPGDASL